MFNSAITAALTGATVSQLANWRRTGLLKPEVSGTPALYSFRDLVALRTVTAIRSHVSLQKIRIAFQSLGEFDLTDHPSAYTLTTDGDTVFFVESDTATDLVKNKNQQILTGLMDVFDPFVNLRGREVPNFVHPRPSLTLSERVMGGFPTITGSAVPYDDVALLLRDGTVPLEYVGHYYPGVDENAARDALDFDSSVSSLREKVTVA